MFHGKGADYTDFHGQSPLFYAIALKTSGRSCNNLSQGHVFARLLCNNSAPFNLEKAFSHKATGYAEHIQQHQGNRICDITY
jgi:hypothetical protein